MEKTKNIDRIETIAAGRLPEKSELAELLATYTEEERTYAACKARKVARSIFGRQVFLRGLIEICLLYTSVF